MTPEREVVRSIPRPPGSRRSSPVTADLYQRDDYALALLRSLIRAQLGVTISALAPAAAVVALYPLVCVLVPRVATARIGPLPLALLVLGGGIYPPLVLLAFWYVRRARRVEQRFIDLLADR